MAWAWAPSRTETSQGEKKRVRWTREEVFDCQQLCRRSQSTELDDDTREARNCTLVHPHPVTRWRSQELVQIHMGLRTRWDREGQDKDFMAPHEPIREEGCPGGYYRCAFVSSLHKYRRRGEHRTENLLLSRCQDRLVLEAIAYLEDEEGHALAAFYEARDSE